MIKPLRALATALVIGAMLPAAAHAQRMEDKAVFDVVIRGISAASLSFSGVQDGNRYAVSGVLKSAGLAALLRKISYTATVKGTVNGARYIPSSYVEQADTGKKKSSSTMTYTRGVPRAVQYTPPREGRDREIDPASQGGTVDTLTALYAILRDVDMGQECRVNLPMYDGRYVSSIVLSKPVKSGDSVTCSGQYKRIAGFKPAEMAERTTFPFTLTYRAAGNGRMRVTEVALDSIYGKAAMKRR
ncbi:Protein of unknown function [Pseudorhodobacter antarcticus]|uniref:DUF3108 domain-containing protein n=1 Tax=Pseudorhodobacter antarcticus TaxID=1077947 RepID=A0A1H8ENM5_9RHOB|nr:DUF3108 domain-containing protein [Pseudorhodobacter antarcticus]SEN20990.1 Protein of unknown function [Pseudorhodobacter antarcticus]